MNVCSNLGTSHLSADSRSKKEKKFHVRGITRRDLIGIVHLAFHDAASWEGPHLVVDVSLLRSHLGGDVRQ